MPANAQPRGQNYSVKNAETVAAGKDLRVRLFTLAPGEVIPWHFHSAIDDEFFVLDGELTVETRASDDYRAVARISHTKRRIGQRISESCCAAMTFEEFDESPDADRV